MKRVTAAVMGVGIMLAACSRSPEPEAAPSDNAGVTEIAPDEAPPPVDAAPPPPPAPEPAVNAAAADPLPPAEEPSADEQMADDAFATGMTARAERGAEAEAPANGF